MNPKKLTPNELEQVSREIRTNPKWLIPLQKLEGHIEAIEQENRRLKEALEKIANEDYRGNQPNSAGIAQAALAGKGEQKG